MSFGRSITNPSSRSENATYDVSSDTASSVEDTSANAGPSASSVDFVCLQFTGSLGLQLTSGTEGGAYTPSKSVCFILKFVYWTGTRGLGNTSKPPPIHLVSVNSLAYWCHKPGRPPLRSGGRPTSASLRWPVCDHGKKRLYHTASLRLILRGSERSRPICLLTFYFYFFFSSIVFSFLFFLFSP